MTTKPDGGPAFPSAHVAGEPGQWYSGTVKGGMSLRDYYAGQALNGMCSCAWPGDSDGPEMARRAYLFADAMLKAGE